MTIESEQQRIKQLKKKRDAGILRMVHKGLSQRAIAQYYGVSQWTVANVVKEGQNDG